jgi:hypothetical protein
MSTRKASVLNDSGKTGLRPKLMAWLAISFVLRNAAMWSSSFEHSAFSKSFASSSKAVGSSAAHAASLQMWGRICS